MATRIRVPIANFQFGEISPSVYSRTDTNVYNNSAKKIQNLLLLSEGGVKKRDGTLMRYDFDEDNSQGDPHYSLDVNNQEVRLLPFIFSDDERYIIAITTDKNSSDEEIGKILCFFLDSDTSINLVSTITADYQSNEIPFTSDIISEITFTQSGDIMFLCHQSFAPRRLVRTGLDSFEVDNFEFVLNPNGYKTNQPYYSFHDPAITLDPSASTGTGITLTTSANYFDTQNYTSDTGFLYPHNGGGTIGNLYRIESLGDAGNWDWTTIGAAVNEVGTVFTLTGYFPSGSCSDCPRMRAVYPPKQIGSRLLYHSNEIVITDIISPTIAYGNILDTLTVNLDHDSIETADGSADIEITFPLHGLLTGDSIDITKAGSVGGITSNQINGTRTIQEVIDENTFVVTAGQNANASAIGGGAPRITTHAPTSQWSEQSYSDYRGFPAAVTFHENRLWFGGTIGQPDGIWASKSGEYFNFDIGDAEDNDSIDITASIGEINTIRHIVSNRDLQIFTNSSELYIPSFSDKPVTPTNAQIRRQTPFGSGFVRPQSLDGATIFLQENSRTVREYIFSDSEAAYVSNPLSDLSNHLFSNKSVLQLGISNGSSTRSESYAFFVKEGGELSVFSSNRAQQKAGWTNWTTNRAFHSVCCIADRVFFIQSFSGSVSLHLTELSKDATFDGQVTEDIWPLSPNFRIPKYPFSNTEIDIKVNNTYLKRVDTTPYSSSLFVSIPAEILDTDETTLQFGFAFDAVLETNPIDANITTGPLSGEPRALTKVLIDLVDSSTFNVNNKTVVLEQVNQNFSVETNTISGRKEIRLLGFSKEPTVKIEQTEGIFLQINGIIAEVSF